MPLLSVILGDELVDLRAVKNEFRYVVYESNQMCKKYNACGRIKCAKMYEARSRIERFRCRRLTCSLKRPDICLFTV